MGSAWHNVNLPRQQYRCHVMLLDRLVHAGQSELDAREAVAAGRVYVDGVQVLDPSMWVRENAEIIERVVWPDTGAGAAGYGSNHVASD
jgi:hypothetical protein